MKFFFNLQIFSYKKYFKKQNINRFNQNQKNNYLEKKLTNSIVPFFLKNGLFVKYSIFVSNICFFINNFVYKNQTFLLETYPTIRWLLLDFIEKKNNSNFVLEKVINLIKPPFIIKSILIPKKLKKKFKQKYFLKIVYKNEIKRNKNTIKQLYYNSNHYQDNNIYNRLYKSIMFSFLDWKNSNLYKLKTLVFKKFFKI